MSYKTQHIYDLNLSCELGTNQNNEKFIGVKGTPSAFGQNYGRPQGHGLVGVDCKNYSVEACPKEQCMVYTDVVIDDKGQKTSKDFCVPNPNNAQKSVNHVPSNVGDSDKKEALANTAVCPLVLVKGTGYKTLQEGFYKIKSTSHQQFGWELATTEVAKEPTKEMKSYSKKSKAKEEKPQPKVTEPTDDINSRRLIVRPTKTSVPETIWQLIKNKKADGSWDNTWSINIATGDQSGWGLGPLPNKAEIRAFKDKSPMKWFITPGKKCQWLIKTTEFKGSDHQIISSCPGDDCKDHTIGTICSSGNNSWTCTQGPDQRKIWQSSTPPNINVKMSGGLNLSANGNKATAVARNIPPEWILQKVENYNDHMVWSNIDRTCLIKNLTSKPNTYNIEKLYNYIPLGIDELTGHMLYNRNSQYVTAGLSFNKVTSIDFEKAGRGHIYIELIDSVESTTQSYGIWLNPSQETFMLYEKFIMVDGTPRGTRTLFKPVVPGHPGYMHGPGFIWSVRIDKNRKVEIFKDDIKMNEFNELCKNNNGMYVRIRIYEPKTSIKMTLTPFQPEVKQAESSVIHVIAAGAAMGAAMGAASGSSGPLDCPEDPDARVTRMSGGRCPIGTEIPKGVPCKGGNDDHPGCASGYCTIGLFTNRCAGRNIDSECKNFCYDSSPCEEGKGGCVHPDTQPQESSGGGGIGLTNIFETTGNDAPGMSGSDQSDRCSSLPLSMCSSEMGCMEGTNKKKETICKRNKQYEYDNWYAVPDGVCPQKCSWNPRSRDHGPGVHDPYGNDGQHYDVYEGHNEGWYCDRRCSNDCPANLVRDPYNDEPFEDPAYNPEFICTKCLYGSTKVLADNTNTKGFWVTTALAHRNGWEEVKCNPLPTGGIGGGSGGGSGGSSSSGGGGGNSGGVKVENKALGDGSRSESEIGVCPAHNIESAEKKARQKGYQWGNSQYPAVGNYGTKGAYVYIFGDYKNTVFYGTGPGGETPTCEELLAPITVDKIKKGQMRLSYP